MKLILIDAGPAAGKNTLGELVVKQLKGSGENAILLDLDRYTEQFNPTWIWNNEEEKKSDQLKALINNAKDIDKYLRKEFIVIVIGERFLTKQNIDIFLKRIEIKAPVYLYHLSIPFALREARLLERGGPHWLIDLKKDQEDRDAISEWPGCIYENINSPEVDSSNLMKLMREEKGRIA